METLLHKFASLIIAPFIFLGSLFSPAPQPAPAPTPIVAVQENTLGSTNAIETPIALFSTTLANSITSSATTMTLTSATTKNGTALASSTYSFIIDEGTASEEFVKADCTSTACTNMDRGLSVITGTTTVATLQKAHRRGASVKITDAPILLNLTRIINGIGTIPNKLSYTSAPTFSAGNELITKTYADNLSYVGAPDMSATIKGVGEKATGAEASSGAADGSGNTTAPLVLTTSIATSTCQTTGNYVLVASSTTGKLGATCFDQTYPYAFSGSVSHTATTTISASSVTNNALTLNSVPYAFPSSQGSASTLLTNNGSGSLSWSSLSVPRYIYNNPTQGTDISGTGGTATSTVYTIPAGVMNASSTIDVFGDLFMASNGAGSVTCQISVRKSTGETFVSTPATTIGASLSSHWAWHAQILPTTSVSAQQNYMWGTAVNTTASAGMDYLSGKATSAINLSNSTGLAVFLSCSGAGLTNTYINAFNIVVNP